MASPDLRCLEDDEAGLYSAPGTFSLPFPCGGSTVSSETDPALAKKRHLLSLSSQGVLEGKVVVTSRAIIFEQRASGDSCISIKISFDRIHQLSSTHTGAVAVSFSELLHIPQTRLNNVWRSVQNYKRVAVTTESPTKTLCLIRFGNSPEMSGKRSASICVEAFDVFGKGDQELSRHFVQEIQTEVLRQVVQTKTALLSQYTLNNLSPPLFCQWLEPLNKIDGAALFIPGGFLLVPFLTGRPVTILLRRCLFAFERMVGKEIRGLELFSIGPHPRDPAATTSTSTYFVFSSREDQQRFADCLRAADIKLFAPQRDPSFLKEMAELWRSGKISNFHYIQTLNCIAGRSENSLSQYPVFPWIVSNYEETFNSRSITDRVNVSRVPRPPAGSKAGNFRDLSRPVGALSHERLGSLLERMSFLPRQDQYLFGSHYSTPAFVAYWRIRDIPELHMKLNHGKIDHHTRLFHSIQDSWESVLKGQTSFMELVPEFYRSDPSFLLRSLPVSSSQGPISDVVLPSDCRCPFSASDFGKTVTWTGQVVSDLKENQLDALWFLFMHRSYFESGLVSRRLHKWIDLIFGYKQRGEPAEEAFNVFHPVTYETSAAGASLVPGYVNKSFNDSQLPLPDSSEDAVTLKQMNEFGQAPLQLFFEAHPPRRTANGLLFTSTQANADITLETLHDQFAAFITSAPSASLGYCLSSIPWQSVLQQCPSLLPVPGLSKRLETTAVLPVSRDRIMSRAKLAGDSSNAQVIGWSGLANSMSLDFASRVVLSGSGSRTLAAIHENRLAIVSDEGELDLFSLHGLLKGQTEIATPHEKFFLPGAARAANFSCTGSHVAVGQDSGSLTLVKVADGPHTERISVSRSAHRAGITCVAANAESQSMIITGSADEAVGIWNIEGPVIKTWCESHSSPVVGVSALGDLLFSSGSDGSLVLRDLRSHNWSSAAWAHELGGHLVGTTLVLSDRHVQVAFSEVTLDSPYEWIDRSPAVTSLWAQLERLSKQPHSVVLKSPLPLANKRRRICPRGVLTLDRRFLMGGGGAPKPISLVHVNGGEINLDVGGEVCKSTSLNCLLPERASPEISSFSIDGSTVAMIGGFHTQKGAAPFLSLVDLMSGKEVKHWRVPPLDQSSSCSRILIFPETTSSLICEPLGNNGPAETHPFFCILHNTISSTIGDIFV